MIDRLSVIVPCHNAGRYLPEAIASIRAQRYPETEIIVVNDGSTDNTSDICRKLGVRLLEQKNLGPGAARNSGVEEAGGNLIAFLDADDIWTAGKIEKQLAVLKQQPEVAIVLGWSQAFLGRDEAWGDPVFCLSLGVTLLRKETFEQVGGFDENLKQVEDTDWFIRVMELGLSVHVLPDVLQWFRRHSDNISHNRDATNRFLIRALKLSLDRRRFASSDRAKEIDLSGIPTAGGNSVAMVNPKK
jgi:glycosyltransferase involved in cell wall biosynthesis